MVAPWLALPWAWPLVPQTQPSVGQGSHSQPGIYLRWFKELSTQGVKVNYQSVGSGAGVRQFTAGSVDFGASDVPMSAKEIAVISDGVVQIPMTAGAIAVAYNNPGYNLKLSQAKLVQIVLGTISNDDQLGCKSKAIRVVHRSDGSGTTANFTAQLVAPTQASEKEALASIPLDDLLTGSNPNPVKARKALAGIR